MKKSLTVYLTLIFIVFNINLFAQLATLSIQGVVRDDNGAALHQQGVKFVFAIYTDSTSLSSIWTETQYLDVENGVYSAVLGKVNEFSNAQDDDGDGSPGLSFSIPYYVGVKVGSRNEMRPLIRLTASPYALSLIGTDNKFPSSGNVGIGTVTPSSALSVKKNGTTLNIIPESGNNVLLDIPGTGTIKLSDNFEVNGIVDPSKMRYMNSKGNSRLRIDRTSIDYESTLQFLTNGEQNFNISLDNNRDFLTFYSYGIGSYGDHTLQIEYNSGQVSVKKGLDVSGDVSIYADPEEKTGFKDHLDHARYYEEIAATDGIVTAWCADNSATWVQAFGYVEIGGQFKLIAKCESREDDSAFIMMPVQKGRKWRVTFNAESGRVDEYDVVWTPMGK